MGQNFLKLVSVDEAVDTAKKICAVNDCEKIPLSEAYGRILAEDAVSDIDIPGFDKSWKDGYAVRAADIRGATESIPAVLHLKGRISMGLDEDRSISKGECLNIPTGGRMPAGADAVVMLEYTEEADSDILIKRPAAVGENVIYKGEDFRKGEVIFTKGRCISDADQGALSAVGYADVSVIRKPVVGIISTGIEIVPPDAVPGPGEIRDVNSYLCLAFAKKNNCIPKMLGIVRDSMEDMKTVISQAVKECDIILITGGSSKDVRDVTAQAIAACGDIYVHGITLAPGKPTIIGKVSGVPVIGIPGHPAAAYMVLSIIAKHMIRKIAGLPDGFDSKSLVHARLTTNISSEKGREEYVRVIVGAHDNDGSYPMAEPLFGKSGILNTVVMSNGIIRIPAGCEGIEAGEIVDVILW